MKNEKIVFKYPCNGKRRMESGNGGRNFGIKNSIFSNLNYWVTNPSLLPSGSASQANFFPLGSTTGPIRFVPPLGSMPNALTFHWIPLWVPVSVNEAIGTPVSCHSNRFDKMTRLFQGLLQPMSKNVTGCFVVIWFAV